MMSGLVDGVETSLSKMFEAVGACKAGIIDEEKLCEFENNTCPGCGSCSGMYTANSMNCLCESLGIALPETAPYPPFTQAAPSLQSTPEWRLWSL